MIAKVTQYCEHWKIIYSGEEKQVRTEEGVDEIQNNLETANL